MDRKRRTGRDSDVEETFTLINMSKFTDADERKELQKELIEYHRHGKGIPKSNTE